jgi:Fur family ferric uptake transcriptional regulator
MYVIRFTARVPSQRVADPAKLVEPLEPLTERLARHEKLTESRSWSRLDIVPVAHAEMLREHGLHVTAQRLAVLDALATHPHSTPNDVAEAVREEIGAISRQSVYDTLAVLAEHDIIRRIQPAGSSPRYEDRVGDNHHHLVCRSCDRLVDVDCAVGDTPCLTPDDTWRFEVHEAEVIYWGVCPECQASTN